ncbi:3-epi-6-deoxocathasterone 23-monooxygenase CYP90C1-like [Silene latifolia]|uniref:3-epi-6-deoxocathasterone 23-monooxygenase CYP90C1-like n=1 Tax=Silene latifolia TaxID=37657 RepID=UPI003D77E050
MGGWCFVLVSFMLLPLIHLTKLLYLTSYNKIQKYMKKNHINGEKMKTTCNNNNMSSSSSHCRVPKGSRGWPFIGETLEFIASSYTSKPVSFMHKRKSLYGKVFKTNLLGKPVIVSTDPEINRAILQNHGNIFVPAYPKSITELFGESSILRMNGVVHKRLHASIGRFLKSSELKAQITRDIENSVKLSLENWKLKQLVYVQDETNKITFEILVKVLMSLGPGEEMEMFKKEFKEFIKGLICLPIKLPGTQLYKSLKAKERLRKMIRRMIEKRLIDKTNVTMDLLETTGDAIDLLLRDMSDQMGRDESDERLDVIAGNIIEMMVPGEDSVPMVMTLAVKYLSDYPLAFKQLMEENMNLKKQKIHSRVPYAWTDYMSLTFTQNVISETLRMTNIINAIWRKATKDVEIKGYLIPEGWGVLASLTSIHMDEENYEKPYLFYPWRWDQKKGVVVASSHAFTPFGGGQRLCPGLELARLEISIFLHHLITTYRWKAEKDEIVYFPTVKMKQKLPISVISDTD